MYDKSFYRTSLNSIKDHIKLGVFCDDIGLARSSLSYFLKDEHYSHMVSVEKLDLLYNAILKYCSNIIG